MTFDKQTLKTLRAKINAALAEVDPDLTFEMGNIRFQSDMFTTKLTVKTKSAAKGGTDLERFLLDAQCKAHNLDANRVSTDGYKLVAFAPTRPKRPWIVERNGKKFVVDNLFAKARFSK